MANWWAQYGVFVILGLMVVGIAGVDYCDRRRRRGP